MKATLVIIALLLGVLVGLELKYLDPLFDGIDPCGQATPKVEQQDPLRYLQLITACLEPSKER